MPVNPPRRPSAAPSLCAVALLALVGHAAAAPAPGEDGVGQWLAEHGRRDVAVTTNHPAEGIPAPVAPMAVAAKAMPERVSEMLLGAMTLLGVPYRRGGESAQGFDCSGFTRHVFGTGLGFLLPRRADDQAASSTLVPVAKADLQPGDLVFFNTLKRTFSHVGIYLGANRFIHAPSTGKDVRIEDLSFAYWAKRFSGARRFEGQATSP
ncbi:MAG: C40 family peptidase [Pseudomonadota bacterium]|nr:C40 family peptidase [Pseudomonadota bacterium]